MATYALIPGGRGDPWEWHRLVPELEALGQEVGRRAGPRPIVVTMTDGLGHLMR